MTTTWYTSDWHFDHAKIMDYQPNRREYLDINSESSIVDMNEAIVEKLNYYISQGDTVYVLGDVSMGNRDESLKYVSFVNGHKHLIMGNHDACHAVHCNNKAEKQGRWMRKYLDAGFESITDFAVTHVSGIAFAMSHFPYEGDHTEESRYDDYRPADFGLPLVHGHLHGLYKSFGRMYNVGIDAHEGIPVSEDQILEWLKSLN